MDFSDLQLGWRSLGPAPSWSWSLWAEWPYSPWSTSPCSSSEERSWSASRKQSSSSCCSPPWPVSWPVDRTRRVLYRSLERVQAQYFASKIFAIPNPLPLNIIYLQSCHISRFQPWAALWPWSLAALNSVWTVERRRWPCAWAYATTYRYICVWCRMIRKIYGQLSADSALFSSLPYFIKGCVGSKMSKLKTLHVGEWLCNCYCLFLSALLLNISPIYVHRLIDWRNVQQQSR